MRSSSAMWGEGERGENWCWCTTSEYDSLRNSQLCCIGSIGRGIGIGIVCSL